MTKTTRDTLLWIGLVLFGIPILVLTLGALVAFWEGFFMAASGH